MMAGIYIHIPFCKQACHYCNFHFSTSLKYRDRMIESLIKEINIQHEYLEGANLESIYFGGGTPSLLNQKEILTIFEAIFKIHSVHSDAEITLEANPDDLSREKLSQLKSTPVNRLSIGIQSFSDKDLQFMNRAHKAYEAETCILAAQDSGFENLTVDLIYGTPTMDDDTWVQNLQKVGLFSIPHFSSYCLTVEPQTALDHFVKKGKVPPVDEEKAAGQFEMLQEWSRRQGYEHYEISNFAKPGRYSRHNTSYWQGKSYLGIGPSAHSFNGFSRQWNIANNSKYLHCMEAGSLSFEKEILTPVQRLNEYLMTGLRTQWGIDQRIIAEKFPDFQAELFRRIESYISKKMIWHRDNCFVLSENAKLFADRIAAELFF